MQGLIPASGILFYKLDQHQQNSLALDLSLIVILILVNDELI